MSDLTGLKSFVAALADISRRKQYHKSKSLGLLRPYRTPSNVYIHEGKRAVGYDNAEGRGDHRHYGQKEQHYRFTDVDTLVEDFKNDVAKAKRGEL